MQRHHQFSSAPLPIFLDRNVNKSPIQCQLNPGTGLSMRATSRHRVRAGREEGEHCSHSHGVTPLLTSPHLILILTWNMNDAMMTTLTINVSKYLFNRIKGKINLELHMIFSETLEQIIKF